MGLLSDQLGDTSVGSENHIISIFLCCADLLGILMGGKLQKEEGEFLALPTL